MTADLGLSDAVRFLRDQEDISDLLAALDLLVLSSKTESFPNVILEATSIGKPVVATRAGGTPEIVEDGRTRSLVPPGNAEALAERVVTFTKPWLRQEIGEAGRKRVQPNILWNK